MSDDQKRQQYDQFGERAFDESQFQSQQMNYEDILRHFGFGGGFGGHDGGGFESIFRNFGGGHEEARGKDIEVKKRGKK